MFEFLKSETCACFRTEGINPILLTCVYIMSQWNGISYPSVTKPPTQQTKSNERTNHDSFNTRRKCIPLPVCSLLQNGLHGVCDEPTRHGYTVCTVLGVAPVIFSIPRRPSTRRHGNQYASNGLRMTGFSVQKEEKKNTHFDHGLRHYVCHFGCTGVGERQNPQIQTQRPSVACAGDHRYSKRTPMRRALVAALPFSPPPDPRTFLWSHPHVCPVMGVVQRRTEALFSFPPRHYLGLV